MAFIKTRRTLKGITHHLVDVVNGKEFSKLLPGVRSKTEANQYLYKYLGDKADNRPNSLFLQKVNFSEFVKTKFLPQSKIYKTEKTYHADLKHLKWILIKFGNSYLNEISAESISLFQTECFNNGLSKKTINNRVAILSSILRMAYKQSLIIRMPEIKLLKLDSLAPKGFSDADMQTILNIAKRTDKVLYDFVIIFLHTGLRLSELQSLKWEDVDLLGKQLMVNKSKNHRYRPVPINDTLFEHLSNLKASQTGQVYLFETNGNPFTTGQYYNRFYRLVKPLGIKGSIHSLRHTFASRLVQRGKSLYAVQKLLGHSTIKTTERYSHLRIDDLADTVSSLDVDGTVTEPKQNSVLKIA